MDRDPTNEELHEFVESLLSNLHHLRDPEVIGEAIAEHRDVWVLLYRASLGFDVDPG